MASGAISPETRNKYDNEVGGHIEAVRRLNGAATQHLEHLRGIANDVLGHDPEKPAEATPPRPVPNGLLQELKEAVSDLGATIEMIGTVAQKLDRLH